MPLKYGFDMPYPNKVFGMMHGLLTVLYLFALIDFTVKYKVSLSKSLLFLIASLVPFGTFYAEKKWLRPIGALRGEH
jgi:integral membrane protein